MHVISVRDAHTAITKDGLHGTQPRMQPKREELRAEGVTLAGPTARGDDRGGVSIPPHIDIRRVAVVSEHPVP